MNISRGITSAGAAMALLLATGCGSTSEEGIDPAPAPQGSEMSSSAPETSESSAEAGGETGEMEEPAEEVVITVENFEYEGPESVSPGATVTVVNMDSAPHTVTSEEEGLFDATFEGGETVTFTAPEEPGEYPYVCTIHPAMTGTLVVE